MIEKIYKLIYCQNEADQLIGLQLLIEYCKSESSHSIAVKKFGFLMVECLTSTRKNPIITSEEALGIIRQLVSEKSKHEK